MIADDSITTESPDDSEVMSGIIIGTGANGDTTYVISEGGTATDDVPVTATLIEGASEATAIVALRDEEDGSVATEIIACGFQDENTVCTLEMAGIVDSVTTTVFMTSTGVADSVTLAVSTSSATATESASDSAAAPNSSQPSVAWKLSSSGVLASSLLFVAATAMMA
ncbi:hypothetical protein ACEPAF_2985 [Sanghuangporus sanghuang]|uniref:Uncharacterized protein n=1 Tax=Sanghuangporus baumii TaxID=108892 RepID=A0A9Q5I528_SANBA|nr:hypothetical protein A7U60_g926 [Sanghuangporus baumii]